MAVVKICTTAYFVGPYLAIRGELGAWKAFDRRPGDKYDEAVATGVDLEEIVSKLESLTPGR